MRFNSMAIDTLVSLRYFGTQASGIRIENKSVQAQLWPWLVHDHTIPNQKLILITFFPL